MLPNGNRRPPRTAAGSGWILGRFGGEEDGALFIFALYTFVLILMMAGIGIDLMRFERDRSLLQSTLDRAVLAATDLNQIRPPRAVVIDYFDKAGLLDYLDEDSIEVTQGINFREVSARADATIATMFMRLSGVDTLSATAAATALERIPNVEISLVLDISSSMNQNGRIGALRPAAAAFIDTVLRGEAKEKTSINLIVYGGQTNPGPWMFAHLNGQRYPDIPLSRRNGGDANGRFPNVSSCLELTANDFTHPDLPKAHSYQQTPHFMYWNLDPKTTDWGWCPSDEKAIIYASNDAAKLNHLVNTMRLHGGTGTQHAIKWAVSLLNPSTQGTFAAMAGDGMIPSEFAARPAAWDDTETAKYIVLMTDGQINPQYRPKDPMDPKNPTVALLSRQNDARQTVSSSVAFSQFLAQCNLAKASPRNITVYTIAFDSPLSVQNEMIQCASSPSHFFNARTDDITSVFASIARQINQLKLVN